MKVERMFTVRVFVWVCDCCLSARCGVGRELCTQPNEHRHTRSRNQNNTIIKSYSEVALPTHIRTVWYAFVASHEGRLFRRLFRSFHICTYSCGLFMLFNLVASTHFRNAAPTATALGQLPVLATIAGSRIHVWWQCVQALIAYHTAIPLRIRRFYSVLFFHFGSFFFFIFSFVHSRTKDQIRSQPSQAPG